MSGDIPVEPLVKDGVVDVSQLISAMLECEPLTALSGMTTWLNAIGATWLTGERTKAWSDLMRLMVALAAKQFDNNLTRSLARLIQLQSGTATAVLQSDVLAATMSFLSMLAERQRTHMLEQHIKYKRSCDFYETLKVLGMNPELMREEGT
jgi:hypothetical protein